MTVRFSRESLSDSLWSEASPLLHAHWREVAAFQDIPLEPDRERYRAIEEAGVVRVFTARDLNQVVEPHWQRIDMLACYKLVGYALYIVNTHLHYASSLQALQDVVYIAPEARGGTGYKFIKWCDEQLAAEGVQVVIHHVKAKPGLNFGPLLERQGYQLVDQIYAKRLDVVKPEVTYDDMARHFAPLRHRDLTDEEKANGVLVPCERIDMKNLV